MEYNYNDLSQKYEKRLKYKSEILYDELVKEGRDLSPRSRFH